MRHFAWSSAWINVAGAANLDKKKPKQTKNTTHKPPNSCRDHYPRCFSSPAREEPQFIKRVEDTWKVSTDHLAPGREKHLFCAKSDPWCLSVRSHRFWWKLNGDQLHKGREEGFEGWRNKGANTFVYHPYVPTSMLISMEQLWEKENSSSEYLDLGTIRYRVLGTIILCCGRAVLCFVGCLATSLVSTHWLPIATPTPTPPGCDP